MKSYGVTIQMKATEQNVSVMPLLAVQDDFNFGSSV